MPQLDSRNLIFARVACFASSVLIALFVSKVDSVKGILDKVSNGIGTDWNGI